MCVLRTCVAAAAAAAAAASPAATPAAAVQVALQRLSPGRDLDEQLVFKGWSKMCTPLASFRITQVSHA
jgi:hypothetical protein